MLGCLLVSWHYWTIYHSLTTAKASLLGVETSLNSSGLDLTASDLATARANVASADTNLRRARFHLRWDPVVMVLGHAPVLGKQIHATNDLLDMAQLVVQIGGEGIAAGDKAIAVRERPRDGQPLTRSLVELLDQTDAQLASVEALTALLVERRIALGDRALLPPLDSLRTSIDQKLPSVADGVEQAHRVRALLPAMLGFGGERRYLVLALNNGELLPGGGLVTAAAVMPMLDGSHGEMRFSDSVGWKARWDAQGGTYIEPPGPLRRHLLQTYTWNLLVSNWSPDFPTWAQQALEFYEMVNGPQDVEGVIAVDLVVLQRLLAVTGPKTIQIEGLGPVTFDATNAVLEMERLTRQSFEPTSDRKSVIGQLADAVLSDLLALPSEKWGEAIRTVRRLGDEKHIQLLMRSPEEQTLVRGTGWDGHLQTGDFGDYLQFNEASVNSTKLNLIVRPEGTLSIDVSERGVAEHVLRLTYLNPFPDWAKGKDPTLVQQLMLGGVYGGYLRVFAPNGTRGFSAEIDGHAAIIEDTGTELGRVWYGIFLPVLPGATAEVSMRWDVPLATSLPSAAEYFMYLEKQPGTDGLCLGLSISRGGKPAQSVSVRGGNQDSAGRTCLSTDAEVTANFR
jgi:hypothetical protein